MNLRSKLSEAAFWHESICLKCGGHDEPSEMEIACDCPEGTKLIVDAMEFSEVLAVLEQEAE